MGNAESASSGSQAMVLPSGLSLPEAMVKDERGRQSPDAKRADFLEALPIEVALEILVQLDGKTLDAASLVCKQWRRTVTSSEYLWRERCKRQWGHVEANGMCSSWKEAHKLLMQGTAIANKTGVGEALTYLGTFGLCQGADPRSAAGFLRETELVSRAQVGKYVLMANPEQQPELLRGILAGQDYNFVLLPDALRLMFSKLSIEGQLTSSRAIAPIFRAFIDRYIECNEEHGPKRESVLLLCYSLLLLSVDHFNPHVKDKMTKREFSRNNRSVLDNEHYSLGYLDRIYDNVCIWGSVYQPGRQRQAADALEILTN